MLWPGVPLKLPLLLLLFTCTLPGIRAEASVGCLFSERLCLEEEWCYDDLAFGRCLRPAGDVDEDDLFRYSLEREGLHELSAELRRLFALGYRWSHGYTQCRLQAMLYAFKNGLNFEPDSCSHLSDNDLEGALKALEGQVDLEPQEVAIIKYTPSVDDPHAAYADEVYYPPVRNGPAQGIREKILAPNAIDLDIPDPYVDYATIKRSWFPQMRAPPFRYADPRRKRARDAVEFLQENRVPDGPSMLEDDLLTTADIAEMYPIIKFLNDMHLTPKEIQQLLGPESEGKLRELLDRFDYRYSDLLENNVPDERFTLTYNTPDSFRAGWETKDAIPRPFEEEFPESRVYHDENEENEGIAEYGSGTSDMDKSFRLGEYGVPTDLELFQKLNRELRNDEESGHPAVYSEGGVVWSEPMESQFKDDTSEDQSRIDLNALDNLLTKYNLGFKRPERLDVKKPGPPFDPQVTEIVRKAERNHRLDEGAFLSMMKKKKKMKQQDFENVAWTPQKTDRIRLNFEDGLRSWSQGIKVKYGIQDILHLTPRAIQNFVVDRWYVSFGIVQQNAKGMSSNEIIELVESQAFKDELEKKTGIRIKSVETSVDATELEDEQYVHVELNKLRSMKQGIRIIKNISDLLHLEQNTFTDIKVSPFDISFKVNPNRKEMSPSEVAQNIESIQDQLEGIEIRSVGVGNQDSMHKVVFVNGENQLVPSMMKKGPPGAHPHLSEVENSQDYVHVEFKKGLKAWKQGGNIIRNISNLLHLEPMAFTDGRVDPYSVVFKVKPNSRGLNASEVAHRIESIKDKLEGVEVISVGVGDKENVQKVISVPAPNENQFYIVIFMVCGILGACIIATALLMLIRKHLKSRQKLQGLARGDTETNKEYQDPSKAKLGAKGQTGDSVHARITSLSRESEQQSPSSRSSTSSWSEEPALHNMDISTGHMVLSYMEDHLKNKDRLEQEWVALCAYVAEPCETSIAQKKENRDKNRYADIVPYDHARVVLNELSNINGSDYINASSITDHDPRNPAYIATQGPLPHTAPDFWQLIWEQGAVVIVMLTRLTEGGAAMCHRYWPEEGSELYHIYEVHLVSEHIWCDDYLVRSFYLKNVRTGETRTVTQFHFLSWPDVGVPSSTKALLEFRRKVNKSYRGRSCPIVVHCSDGAGRTGTYCLIDMVLSRMAKGAKEIDIAATLEHLRDQRPKMVAAKQQFEFVLTAVAEEVHAILKALPAQPNQSQEKEK